jgi:hypothetical protein
VTPKAASNGAGSNGAGSGGSAARKGSGSGSAKRPPAPEFGNALRSAYQRTLAEDIPPEMLDLLGKLG